MKKVLIVGQGRMAEKKDVILRLKKLNYQVYLLVVTKKAVMEELYEDVFICYQMDQEQIQKRIIHLHESLQFDGVLCYDEGAVVLADQVSKWLNLKPISYKSHGGYKYKHKMRQLWQEAGVRIPNFKLLKNPEEALKLGDELEFPFVLKPTSMMSSCGVIRIDHAQELQEKAHIPFETDIRFAIDNEQQSLKQLYSLESYALAEEFIGGQEFSAEGIVVDGEYYLFGVTEKTVFSEKIFDELAEIYPYPNLDYDQLLVQLRGAHKALDLANCLTHTEFKVYNGEVYFIELGARMVGGYVLDLVEKCLKVDPIELMAKCSIGELDPSEVDQLYKLNFIEGSKVTASLIVVSSDKSHGKHFDDFNILDFPGVNVIKVNYDIQHGDLIQKSPYNYVIHLGFLLVEADSYEVLSAAANEFVKNDWVQCLD